MDVKVGSGAFMPTYEKSQELAQSIASAATGAGCATTAILTDMSQPLASSAGNALEIREAVEFLTGVNVNPRLYKITMTLCCEMLILSKLAKNAEDAQSQLETVLNNGKAAEVFAKMVSALGGPTDFIENLDHYLPSAKIIRPVYSQSAGIITEMNTREIGLAVVNLGGGRVKSTDKIDYRVGLSEFITIGEQADSEKPLAMIHAQTEEQFKQAAQTIQNAMKCRIESEPLTQTESPQDVYQYIR